MKKSTSIYNTKPNGNGIPKETSKVYQSMSEGYIPPPKKEKDNGLQMSKLGNIVEITLGDKTFAIHDPARIEGIINLVEKHETSMYNMRQSHNQVSRKVQELTREVNALKSDIRKLQEQINNGGSFL